MQYVIAVYGPFSQQLSPKIISQREAGLKNVAQRTTSLFLNPVVLFYLMLQIYSLFKHDADCLNTNIYLKEMKATGTYCMLAWLLCPRAWSTQVHITLIRNYISNHSSRVAVPTTQLCNLMFVGSMDSKNRIIELC